MKQINKHIQNKLQENADLIDKSDIDNTLSYTENKEEISQKIQLLQSQEGIFNDLINAPKNSLIEQSKQTDNKLNRFILKELWKETRRIHRTTKLNTY